MIDTSPPEVDNVLLFIVDALRTDRVGVFRDADEASLTPNIDAIARDGEVFDSCFACVNATDAAMTTIMTGLYPTRHGIINHGDNVTEQERKFVSATTPLPELLAETHRSVGVDMLGRWHKRGFDDYFMDRSEGWIEEPDSAPSLPVRAARSVYGRVPKAELLALARRVLDVVPEPLPTVAESIYIDHLSAKNPYSTINRFTQNSGYLEADWVSERIADVVRTEMRNWFVLGHFWDTHLPYHTTEDHLRAVADRTYPRGELSIEKLVEPIAGSSWAQTLQRMARENGWTTSGDIGRAYDASIRLVDEAIGAVIGELKAAGSYEDTAIIVTSDHGESLIEHGILFDHHGLYDPTIHVPLIVKAPSFAGREPGFVQHTDIVPTILDLLGYSVDSTRFDGESLRSDRNRIQRRTAVAAEEGNAARKRAIRTDSYKYIVRLDERQNCRYCGVQHAANSELYDLHDDPEEVSNLATEKSSVVDRLDAELTDFIDSVPPPREGRVSFDEDEAVLKQLEYMGYK